MVRIALVEDNPDLRSSIGMQLERLGHDVEMHENGRAIVENEGDFEPDVVLTDMLMPGTDGMETIRSLVRRYPEVRIIAMSGGLSGDDPGSLTRWAMMVGAHHALAKPFTSEELESGLDLILDAPSPDSSTDTGPGALEPAPGHDHD